MDPLANPYTPNAGARPPALVGRDRQIADFELLIARLGRGHTEKSMIITGLRGVGKTVLLGRFRQIAEDAQWSVVEWEISKHDDTAFRRTLAAQFRTALLTLSPRHRWQERATRAANVLRSFTLSVDPEGHLTAGLGAPAEDPIANSGDLLSDLTHLIVAVGEAAQEADRGVVMLLDEVQFLSAPQLESLISALHKSVQRALPMTLVGAGLPQVAQLAGEAKSYAERLFTFPVIGNLTDDQAHNVLQQPARAEGAEWDQAALALATDLTGNYPFFLQELGYAVWPAATAPRITAADVTETAGLYRERLDTSFFRVRLDRTTDLEKAYLRAMAELGPDPASAAEVAKLVGRSSQQAGPTRATLIDKGLLYSPSHGLAAFTVPHFDQFMHRAVPTLDPPQLRPRKRRKDT
jgi:hypothetical protein